MHIYPMLSYDNATQKKIVIDIEFNKPIANVIDSYWLINNSIAWFMDWLIKQSYCWPMVIIGRKNDPFPKKNKCNFHKNEHNLREEKWPLLNNDPLINLSFSVSFLVINKIISTILSFLSQLTESGFKL